jgi:hypothetical protein
LAAAQTAERTPSPRPQLRIYHWIARPLSKALAAIVPHSRSDDLGCYKNSIQPGADAWLSTTCIPSLKQGTKKHLLRLRSPHGETLVQDDEGHALDADATFIVFIRPHFRSEDITGRYLRHGSSLQAHLHSELLKDSMVGDLRTLAEIRV